MDKNLINSHDRFFKELFSKKEEVREFIAQTLPNKLNNKLDLETLELDATEYIDKKLQTNFSDIVYNCWYDTNITVKISLLFEHKSYPETYPHLQLLGYILKIWETQIKQKQNLTPVVPIIFYHGKQKWQQKTFENYFENLDEDLQKFIPKFDYQLIDTSNYTNQQIKELFKSLELQVGLLIMKNIYDEHKILQEMNQIFADVNTLLQTEKGEQFFETIVSYLYFATKIETQKFVDKMRTLSPKAEEKFISTAMQLEMKGIEKGIEKGIKKGIKKGIETGVKKVAFSLIKQNVPDQIILASTNLSQKELNDLKTLKEYHADFEVV